MYRFAGARCENSEHSLSVSCLSRTDCEARRVLLPAPTKKHPLTRLLIRMFGVSVGAIIDRPQPSARNGRLMVAPTKSGRDIVFSADLCYNGANEKPSSGRKVARDSVTEGARVTLNLDILHCNAFSLSHLRRQRLAVAHVCRSG